MNKLKHDADFAEAQAPAMAVAASELRQIVERIERINDDMKSLREDRSEFFAEAKSRGYCTKTLRRVIKEREKDADLRQEEDALFDLYATALGLK